MRVRFELVFSGEDRDRLPTTRQLYDALLEGLRFRQGFTCPMNLQELTTDVDLHAE